MTTIVQDAIKGSRSYDRPEGYKSLHLSQKQPRGPKGVRNGFARDGAAARALIAATVVAALALHLLDTLVLSDTARKALFPWCLEGCGDLPRLMVALAPAIVGALIGGGASLLGSGISYWGQRKSQEEANRANLELAKYGYSKDLEMWNRMNQYNDPGQQMARLQRAGLNPNLVYGSGSAAGNVTGQLPKFNAPRMEPLPALPPTLLTDVIGQFQDFRLKNAVIENRDIQNREKSFLVEDRPLAGQPFEDASVTYMPAWMKKKLQDIRAKDQAMSMKAGLYPWQYEVAKGAREKQQADIAKLVAATRNLDLQNDYFAAKAISSLFGGLVGNVGKIGAMVAKKQKGVLSPGTVKAPGAGREIPRYNSASSWQDMMRSLPRRFD